MDNNAIPFLGGLIGFLLSIFLSFSYLTRIVQIHRAASLPTGENPAENVMEVAGNIVSEGRIIHSPLTQTPCALWHAEVLELRSSGEDSYWATIFDETSVHPFDVMDLQNGTGVYTIYPSGAELLLRTDMFQQSAIHVTLEPKIMKAVEKLPISPTGPFGLTKPLRLSEKIIKADEAVYILGKIKEEGGVRVILSSQDGSPFLISDQSQRATLAILYWRVIATAFLLTALGVFLAQFVVNNK